VRSLKKLNLLFVEDNLPFARNTTEFLKNYFRKIIHAPSIKEALLEFEDNRIDLIFCDIKLQDGNGLDFIETVRAKNGAIPIVVLSAHKDEEFLFQAIPLGILSYELKPLKYENFIKLLQKIASKFSQKAPLQLASALLYDPHAKEIIKGLLRIKLTKKEILFLELLLQNDTKVTTLAMVQRDVWDEKFMSDSAIKNLVFRLRKKVDEEFILTLQGIGYKLKR
jgi:DNA-binding response OmpR family regulator